MKPSQDFRDLLVPGPAEEQARKEYLRFRGETFNRPRRKRGNGPLQPVRIKKG